MAYKYVKKTCANCLHSQEVLAYFNDEKDDYEGFLNYSSAELETCKKCGYSSYDIEQNSQDLKDIVPTKEYIRAKEYGYIDKNLVDEYEYIFESYPANEYEAYAIHQKQNNNTKDYVRAMFASAIYTMSMVNQLNHELQIEGDELTEKEIKDYKYFIEALNKEIDNKCNKIFEINYQNSLNDKIIYLLCCKRLQNNKLFEENYKQIQPKISEKLQKYIFEF